MNEKSTPLVQLAQALEHSPVYLFSFLTSILAAMVSDPMITVLTIGVVLVGVLTNAMIAVAIFCFIYVFIRTLTNVANAIGISGQRIAEAQQPQMVPQMFPSTTVMPPTTE